MRKRKKQGSILKKLFIIGLVLFFIVFFGVQGLIGKFLTNLINTKSGDFLAAKAEVQSIDINLANASFGLKDLKIFNPPGFKGEQLYTLKETFYDVSWLALITKTIAIETVSIEESVLNIEKNKEGKLNIFSMLKESEETTEEAGEKTDISGALKQIPDLPEKKDEAEEEENKETKQVEEKETKEDVDETKDEEKEEAKPAEPLKAVLEDLFITSTLNFTDLKKEDKPFSIAFDTKVEMANIKTFGDVSDEGNVLIKGNLKGKKNEFVTLVKATISPLTDLTKPTFTSKALVESVDMEKLSAYKDATGISQGKLGIESNIVCVDGMIIKEKSTQSIKIRNLMVSDKMKNKLKGQTPPSELAFTFHVYGSIDNPKTDFMKSFLKALINPTSLISSKVSGKLSKELSKNEDAKKALAKSGFGASLGLGAATSDKKETAETGTTQTEDKKEEPAKPAEDTAKKEAEEKAKAKKEELKAEAKKAKEKAKAKFSGLSKKLF